MDLSSLDKLFTTETNSSGIYIDPSVYTNSESTKTAINNTDADANNDGEIKWTEDGTYGIGSYEDFLAKMKARNSANGHSWGKIDDWVTKHAYEDAIEKAKAQYEAQQQAAAAQSATGDTSTTASAEENRNAETQLSGVNNPYPEDYTGNQQAVDTQQAIAEGAQTAQQEAEKSAASSASAGINKSRAGMLSDSGTSSASTNNVSNIAMGNTSQNASTQADYLNKMNQADALNQQAKFQSQGAGITALGAGMQGAASGAALGAVISDENAKESPDDFDSKLSDAINQFKILYKRVKEKRGRK